MKYPRENKRIEFGPLSRITHINKYNIHPEFRIFFFFCRLRKFLYEIRRFTAVGRGFGIVYLVYNNAITMFLSFNAKLYWHGHRYRTGLLFGALSECALKP